MAKKNRRKLQPVEPPVEALREDVARAREYLVQLRADVSYSRAKKIFRDRLGMSSGLANACVVALDREGFEGGERNWFRHPEAPTETGVVRGAREIDNLAAMSQTDPAREVPLPYGLFLPDDVVELRASESGAWRVAGFVRRPVAQYVCRLSGPYAHEGEKSYFARSVNVFCPIVFSVPVDEVPADVDPQNDVVAIVIDESLRTEGAPVFGLDPTDEVPAHFSHRVARANDPLGEVAIASAEYGIPVDFCPEALAESEALPDEVDGRSMLHRVDLTDIPFVTIDGEDARDFDDAVYCEETAEGWRLLVAIADVSHYVKPGSALDRDAQMRSTSVYFPASVVPMLPVKLSNGLCSLNPEVDRLVMVCDALVNREGRTTAYQFYPGVIHSHARLTYTEVWSALREDAAGLRAVGERIAEIRRLRDLFKSLRAAREKRFALDFETEESMAVFGEDGSITGFKVREHNDAHRIIEECMLVANVCAAEFVTVKKARTLFRVHPKPEPDRLRALNLVLRTFGHRLAEPTPQALSALIRETKGEPVVQAAILRSMSRAQYQPENIGHFGLQYEAYAHFTSPIRRYPDLLLHRTIKGILAKRAYVPALAFDDASLMSSYHARKLGSRPEEEKTPKTRTEERQSAWTRLGIITSAAERRADDASRAVMNYLKCDFIDKRRKEVFEARVTGMIAAGIFVSLERWPIEGFVHISNLGWGYYEYDEAACTMTSREELSQVKLGDRVRVRIETVDMTERRISFALVSNLTRRLVVSPRGGSRRSRCYRGGFDRFERFDSYGEGGFGDFRDDEDND